jgi:hypothetical protein
MKVGVMEPGDKNNTFESLKVAILDYDSVDTSLI